MCAHLQYNLRVIGLGLIGVTIGQMIICTVLLRADTTKVEMHFAVSLATIVSGTMMIVFGGVMNKKRWAHQVMKFTMGAQVSSAPME